MYKFTIELAGVPIQIQCRFKENRTFFEGYFSDKEPLLKIEPHVEDFQRIQGEFDDISTLQGTEKTVYHYCYLENNAIHDLIAKELLAYHILLMHGSALCMDGKAYVFIASSGTGKSTHARLWRETFGDRVWMINDDKPLLSVNPDQILVYGSPWNGKHRLGKNACAPLKAVVHLNRSEQNSIRRIPEADAFLILLKHTLQAKEPAEKLQILEMQKNLILTVPFYSLQCNMTPDAATTAWRGMNPSQFLV